MIVQRQWSRWGGGKGCGHKDVDVAWINGEEKIRSGLKNSGIKFCGAITLLTSMTVRSMSIDSKKSDLHFVAFVSTIGTEVGVFLCGQLSGIVDEPRSLSSTA